jgi:hypothetical protein
LLRLEGGGHRGVGDCLEWSGAHLASCATSGTGPGGALMASRTEGAIVNMAALVQGIVLVTFPAASTTVAAAVVVVRHHSAFLTVVFAFLAFALLSRATVGLIFLYFARRPGEAEAHLSDLRDRLVRAGPAVFAIVSLSISPG